MSRILVVDDDRQLLKALRIALTARGHEVLLAHDAATALAVASHSPPDLAIIDLGLPDADGITIVESLRGWTSTPIIVLSARHTEPTKIDALDAGADDYITKPFSMGELLARVRAGLRRAAPAGEAPVVRTGSFTIDLAAKRITRADGTEIRLTPTEWHLLEILARNPDRLVTQQHLLHEVWGPRYENETNYLRVHLANLRRKLEPDPSRPRYLRTEPGLGYRFAPDDAP
ncbi:response regulator [Catellatospora sp. KI3]|uniref:response regulator n=1 Tax=Catellatospora sp. KI3 TaxID=3041620 RepID=UPI0024829C0B|nr:response regulator [Catellatospora sp. KI3]MDI1462179.1 response regulator [Catellatospora sp. KI3]